MRALVVPGVVLLLAACGAAPPREAPAAKSEPAAAPRARAVNPDAPVLVAFGDSLTAGHGIGVEASYPTVLEAELAARGSEMLIVNEGVSGDTTSSALARIDVAVSHAPAWALVALGANDGLRGLPVTETEANLRRIVERFREAGAQVALAGMKLPPNYGPEYVKGFEAIYPRIAEELSVPLMPFLLEEVAAEPSLNLDDGIHPNEEGARIVARNVADFLVPLLNP